MNNIKKLPFTNPLRLGIFGPAIILLAFGQATGELIHWPYLMIKYGLFFLFLLLPACLIQFPIFGFLARHTILSGESHFSILSKLNKLYAVIVWLIFVLTSIWIASYTASAGIAFAKLYAVESGKVVDLGKFGTYFALAINTVFFFILLLTRNTYRFVSGFMEIIAGLSVIVISILFFWSIYSRGFDSEFFLALFEWKFSWPANWVSSDLKLIITAFVFAGLGGLWNVLYSVWLRQEGMGMASHNKSEFVDYQDEIICASQDAESIGNYSKSMNILQRDLWIGIGGNTLMILMIAYMAYESFPKSTTAPTGTGIITSLGDALSYSSVVIGRIFYIFVGLFLVDTWVAAADTLSKLHANMVISLINSNKPLPMSNDTRAKLFYVMFLVLMLVMTFVSSFITQPQKLNYLNGILSMFGSVLLIIGLFIIEQFYKEKLGNYPKHRLMYSMLVLAFVVYLTLSILFVVI
jgi:hypothetical protein